LLEENIEVTDAFFDMAYLFFALRNQGVLEIDLVLRCQMNLFLLLKLELLSSVAGRAFFAGQILVESRFGGRDGSTLLI